MHLSEREILERLASGSLIILGPKPSLPFDAPAQVRPAPVDLRLDSRVWVYAPKGDALDVSRPEDWLGTVKVDLLEPGMPIRLPPQGLVHGQVYEQMKLPEDVAGRISARSRAARLGLAVHCSGDHINPGFKGAMPLQLVNLNPYPVTIFPHMSLVQLVLFRLGETPLCPYAGRPSTAYQGKREASPSVLHQDAALRGQSDRTLEEEEERRLVEQLPAASPRALRAVPRDVPGRDAARLSWTKRPGALSFRRLMTAVGAALAESARRLAQRNMHHDATSSIITASCPGRRSISRAPSCTNSRRSADGRAVLWAS